MTESVAYWNGRIVRADQVAIGLSDAGFTWGATVSDRLRTFGGVLFRVQDHLTRFRESCELAHIPLQTPDAELLTATEQLVDANGNGTDLSLVWVATPGNLIAYTLPLDLERHARLFREGARLVTVAASLGTDPRIKHRSRLPWWIATQKARELDPDAEPLFIDPVTGDLLETPTASLLAMIDGEVRTPPAGTVLDGISRRVVRELCASRSIPFAEGRLSPEAVRGASEVMLANSSYCLAGVSRIDGHPVPFPGPVLRRLVEAWSELVGMDIRPDAARE